MNQTVKESTVDKGLCISCGICVAACPVNCISMQRKRDMYLPEIDKNRCIECGICANICSMHQDGCEQKIPNRVPIICYSAYALDKEVRAEGTSGGCISALVKALLNQRVYDVAFLVKGYEYTGELLSSQCVMHASEMTETAKSRYLPVSQTALLYYAKKYPQKKIIVVATGCVVKTFLNAISQQGLKRENYLILGLFCDKNMSLAVLDYFSSHFGNKKPIQKFYFRTKESGGWPGNVKIIHEDGTSTDLNAKERQNVKEYFQPECCLYCSNKLNDYSDIAFGDDYRKTCNDRKGRNSVIVRTKQGEEALSYAVKELYLEEVPFTEVVNSQSIWRKKQNIKYRELKFCNRKKHFGIKIHLSYGWAMIKIMAGRFYNKYPFMVDIIKGIRQWIHR